jgi:hypothetical protein
MDIEPTKRQPLVLERFRPHVSRDGCKRFYRLPAQYESRKRWTELYRFLVSMMKVLIASHEQVTK